jgi:hypothetical protein
MPQRDGGVKVVASKERCLSTIFGDVRVKRRLYRDKDGNYRFLLDEKMGLDKGNHVSPRMKELAILASTHYTFREVEQNIKAIFPWAFLIPLSIIFQARWPTPISLKRKRRLTPYLRTRSYP